MGLNDYNYFDKKEKKKTTHNQAPAPTYLYTEYQY